MAPSFSIRLQTGLLAAVSLAVLIGGGWLVPGAGITAQQAPAGQPPAGQRDAGGPPRGPLVDLLDFSDRTGFTAIFDGKSLESWDGDTNFWRAEGGSIIGETTPGKELKANTFLIWRGGEPKDFELKLEYRLSSTNSGIQYRSREVPAVGKWVLTGYQADIDFDNMWTGQLYEERGRQFLALRGQAAQVLEGKKSRLIGELESRDALKALIKNNDWNQFHIIARGSTLVHVVNGHVMAVVVDDDAKNRATAGLLGFQMHVGPPMKVEFRGVALKTL